ncbi:MAG: tRNA lysidine(34) synthetase TilS [Bacteroidota bacterium]|nr:tRNA lysidine(34) synthetase TilS [Bacteroidota bacterium]
MLSKFKSHINTKLPFLKGKKLLLACSGGLDSVVLTHLCNEFGLDITLAHCNFKLRGAESDGDETFVQHLANALELKVLVKEFDTLNYAQNHRGSVQMAARELRYQWFKELLDTKNFFYLLTAHHLDDDLETFLINLSRGTGLEGLLGIPEQNEKVVRPLLLFTREEIRKYADEQHIQWREDSSNSESKYLRNKIRHKIVPKLKQLHPTFVQNFVQTQVHLQQSSALIHNHLQEIKNRLFQLEDDSIKIEVSGLQKLKPLDSYLYGLFHEFGFSDWEAVHGLLTGMSGKEVLSKTHRLLKDRDCLILSELKTRVNTHFPVYDKDTMLEQPIKLTMEKVDSVTKPLTNAIFLDKEKLNFPMVLRNWEKGDYFYPFGMQGKKKLSKFFKDEKIDVVSKENQWLLCSDDEIVWVVGKRADERFRVDDTTRQIVKITWIS